jgi:hypothetical protein
MNLLRNVPPVKYRISLVSLWMLLHIELLCAFLGCSMSLSFD